MKTIAFSLIAAAALSSTVFAGAKEYQVSGPVTEVNDKMITVMKGSEKWELDRDSNTKVNGDVKTGDKVTIQYTMTAKKVDVKSSGKKDEKASPSASPKK